MSDRALAPRELRAMFEATDRAQELRSRKPGPFVGEEVDPLRPSEPPNEHSCECGEELDRDCFGNARCPDCDGPCPGCSDQ